MTVADLHRRLHVRSPYPTAEVYAFLEARAIAGVEVVDGQRIRRVVRTADRTRILELAAAPDRPGHPDDGPAIDLRLDAAVRPAELAVLERHARCALDLDADPAAIVAALGDDPVIGRLVRSSPGRRLPGTLEPWAALILAIAAQGVSVASARATLGRIAERHGTPVRGSRHPALRRVFPGPERLAGADLTGLGLTGPRARTVDLVARAVGAGVIDLEGGEPAATLGALREIPGIGPWTLGYVALRIHHDPDAFPPGDAAVRTAFRRLGLDADDRSVSRAAEAWRPWRGYALMHLWASLRH